jgi:hypothetical protein
MTKAQKIVDIIRPGQTWSAYFAETHHREDITIQSAVRWIIDPWGDEYGLIDVTLDGGEPLLVTVDDLVRMSVILTADPDWPIYQGVPMTPGRNLWVYLPRCQRTCSFTVTGRDGDQVVLTGETFDVTVTPADMAVMKLTVGPPPTADRPVFIAPAWSRRPTDDNPTPRFDHDDIAF